MFTAILSGTRRAYKSHPVLATVLVAAVALAADDGVTQWRRNQHAWHAVKYGVMPPEEQQQEFDLMPQPQQVQRIRDAIQSAQQQQQQQQPYFYLIDGESGVGKTTLVRQAVRETADRIGNSHRIPGTNIPALMWEFLCEVSGFDRWHGGGMLYMQIHAGSSGCMNRNRFGSDMADAFHLLTNSHSVLETLGITNHAKGDDQLSAVLDTLSTHAARYRTRSGKKVTVVIDACDLLVRSNTETDRHTFEDLVSWAATQANSGSVTVVFVTSGGLGIDIAESAACARMRTIEIREETDEAALTYMRRQLQNEIGARPQLDVTIQKVVAELTGGCAAAVRSAIGDLRRGEDYEQMRHTTLTNITPKFTAATIIDGQHTWPAINAVAHRLLRSDNGSITGNEFNTLVAETTAAADNHTLARRLLRHAVFGRHHDDTVTFRTRAMRTLLASKIDGL